MRILSIGFYTDGLDTTSISKSRKKRLKKYPWTSQAILKRWLNNNLNVSLPHVLLRHRHPSQYERCTNPIHIPTWKWQLDPHRPLFPLALDPLCNTPLQTGYYVLWCKYRRLSDWDWQKRLSPFLPDFITLLMLLQVVKSLLSLCTTVLPNQMLAGL